MFYFCTFSLLTNTFLYSSLSCSPTHYELCTKSPYIACYYNKLIYVKETTHATYARAYTRPYQKTGTEKLKLNGNMYGTGRSVHRPFNSRFLNGRARCTDRTGKLFFDAYCTTLLCTGIYVTARFATADRLRSRPAGFEAVDPLRSRHARLLRRSIELAHAYYHAPFTCVLTLSTVL